MNPSPTGIMELCTFVEVALVQYATVAGHLPGVSAAAAQVKPKKVEVVQEEPERRTCRPVQPLYDPKQRA